VVRGPCPDLVELRVLCVRDDVGGEGVAVGLDGGLVDVGVSGDGVFDFGGFDALAAEFDLAVGAAEVFDFSVGASAGEVAGGVHAGAGGGVVGVGEEGLGGEGCLVVVAVGEGGSGDVEVSGDAGGGGAESFVEDVDAGVVDWFADGDGVLAGLGVVRGDVDGGFGGPVEVVELGRGIRLVEAVGGFCGQGFPAGEDVPQRAPARGRVVEEALEHRGDEMRGGDVPAVDQLVQVFGVAVSAGFGDDEG